MLGLVGMLLLIVISIDFTRQPENWRWFFAIGDQQAEPELKELSLDDLDFRLEDPGHGTLPHDTFVAVAPTATDVDFDELGLDIQKIPAELLEGVQDKRVGMLRSEQEAMDRVLKRVRTLSQAELETAASRDIGFRVVFTDAAKYRGELIEIEGLLWKFQAYPFGDPEDTTDDLWQAWMFSSDSGNNPWVVFMTEKPAGLEPGEAVNRDVSIAGYFFKNYGYATEQGLHIAPMLIARTMSVKPLAPAVDSKTENINLYVFFFLMSIGLLFGAMIYWFIHSDRKFNKSHLAEIAESRHDLTNDFVSNLSQFEAKDPNQLELPNSDSMKNSD